MISKILHFIRVDIWRIPAKQLSGPRSFLIKQLRIVILSLRGFDEDKCQLRASALTFYSLLSIVPVVAMAFAMAKGFGLEKMLEEQLLKSLQGQEAVAIRVIEFAHTLLDKAKGGVMAGLGVVVLLWTVIKVLGNIERSFNDIWGIKKSRTLVRKLTDYISIMLFCPILFVLSSSATVVISSKIKFMIDSIGVLGAFSPLILFSLKLLPWGVLWILFTFIYMFMPNTKVRFRSAFLAGISIGTMYQILQWTYITFQIGVSKYGAIYGGFAALPLFLFWLQLSWMIVLLGAEVSFAHQNVETYEFEPDCLNASHSFRRLLALRMVHECVKRFANSQDPVSPDEISHNMETPIRLVREILYELVNAGVLSEVRDQGGRVTAYQPARDINTMTLKNIIDSLEQYGSSAIPVAKSEELEKIHDSLKSFDKLIKESPQNLVLKDI